MFGLVRLGIDGCMNPTDAALQWLATSPHQHRKGTPMHEYIDPIANYRLTTDEHHRRQPAGHPLLTMTATSRPIRLVASVGAIAGLLVGTVACGDAPARGSTSSRLAPVSSEVPASPSTTPTNPPPATVRPTPASTAAGATTTTSATAMTTEPIDFPPAGLTIEPDAPIQVGELIGLRNGGQWMFGIRPPSTLVRIDPESAEVVELDLQLGESRSGPAQHTMVGERVWVLGGPFRDQLAAVDPVTMTEVARLRLDDDHSIASNAPMDAMWLLSLRSIRRVDDDGVVRNRIDLEVDPVAVAASSHAAWVSLPPAAQVARVDAFTGTVTTVATEPGPGQLVLDGTTLWVAHPPTGSISRIDTTTSEVIGVTELDLAGDEAAVTAVTGLRPAPEGLWAVVRYDGSPYQPILVLLDRTSGDVLRAGTLEDDIGSTADHADGLWLHRIDDGTLVELDRGTFVDSSSTTELEPPGVVSTSAASSIPPADDVADVFARFVDPAIDSSSLTLGPLEPVRNELINLIDAQVRWRIEVRDVVIDGSRAVVVFDVVVDDGTVVLPAVELGFERLPSDDWTIDAGSLCVLAEGVGVHCPA